MKSRHRLLAAAVLATAAATSGQQLLAQGTASVPAQGVVPSQSAAPMLARPEGALTAIVRTADDSLAAKPAGPRNPLAALTASLQTFRDSIVSRARAQIGTRYKLGGTAPEGGFDCSGLVRFVARAFDIKLPRTAREQATAGVPVPKDLAAMKPGDLLTFGKGSKISHIAIYVGEGRFVHASTANHKVIETSLVGTHSPLIKQWQGVRRLASGTSVKLRDSVLAMLDTLH